MRATTNYAGGKKAVYCPNVETVTDINTKQFGNCVKIHIQHLYAIFGVCSISYFANIKLTFQSFRLAPHDFGLQTKFSN